jgi:tRNA U34 5-methylaminomethyl-2-thiouridine-forming methyltransferase MnmC
MLLVNERDVLPGGWRAVRTADGSWTLAHPGHGETCHSIHGAWTQARERYAIPCRLRELARERSVVRLLDVGTGLGLNIAAALEALDGSGAQLEAVTLERDLDVLAIACAQLAQPPEVERWLGPVRAALALAIANPGRATVPLGERSSLALAAGDAAAVLPALSRREPFDAVFLDPFSRRREDALWTDAFARALAARMAPHAVLSTYSASLAVRAALARAGLRVGAGPRVGAKAEGTLASLRADLPPLGARSLRKLAQNRAADLAGG